MGRNEKREAWGGRTRTGRLDDADDEGGREEELSIRIDYDSDRDKEIKRFRGWGVEGEACPALWSRPWQLCKPITKLPIQKPRPI